MSWWTSKKDKSETNTHIPFSDVTISRGKGKPKTTFYYKATFRCWTLMFYQGTVNSVCSRLYLNTHMFSNLLNFDIFCKKTWDYLKKKENFLIVVLTRCLMKLIWGMILKYSAQLASWTPIFFSELLDYTKIFF